MTAETSAPSPQQWTPANGGRLRRGGGRPRVTKAEQDFLQTLKAKTPELVEALLRQVAKGNIRAIELALAYVVGKPTDKVELSGPDGGPIETHAIAKDDHEAALLKNAIERELARRDRVGATAPDTEGIAVEGAGS